MRNEKEAQSYKFKTVVKISLTIHAKSTFISDFSKLFIDFFVILL